jgi:hypothetical protein
MGSSLIGDSLVPEGDIPCALHFFGQRLFGDSPGINENLSPYEGHIHQKWIVRVGPGQQDFAWRVASPLRQRIPRMRIISF